MLAVKRARPRLALFAATFLVVFLLGALAVGLSGYLAGASTAGARAGLAALTGSSGGFRITIPLAANARAQDGRVRSEIHDTIRAEGQRVPVHIATDIETPAAVELDGPRGVVRSALASIPGLAGRAELVSGRWPTKATEASIQADAASNLGVLRGDRYTLPGGALVTIVGTWRVHNAADPVWLGDGIPISGLGYGGVAGFVVIDPSLWASVGSAPESRWTVVPDAESITPTQLGALQSAPDTVSNAVGADRRNGPDVNQDGRLQPAMVPIVRNVQAAAAVSIAPLVIVAVLGIVTLTELARMLIQLRSGESELLRARGATRTRLVWSAAAEAAIVAIPAAALGALAAAAILPLLAHAAPVPPIGWLGAGAAALVAIIVLAGAAGLASADEDARVAERGERTRGIVGIALVSLTVLAAIVAVSQFVLYGTPLVSTASGAVGVDPLAVTAPALALAAMSLLGLALFPLVSRAAERIARGRVGLGSLPVQQLARRNRAAITPVLLVALAVGGLVFASTYSGTWQTSSAQTRAVQVGTGVRVSEQGSIPAAETREVAGQVASAPVGAADVQIGDSLVPMMEIPADRLRTLVNPVPGAVNPSKLASQLADRVDRPEIPSDTRTLDIGFRASRAAASPRGVNVTVVDSAGALATVEGIPTGTGFRVRLPRGVGPWVMRAIDLTMPRVHEKDSVRLMMRSAETGQTIPLGDTWTLSSRGVGHAGFATLGGTSPGVSVTASIDGGLVRLQPRAAHGSAVPLIITAALAKSAGLRIGEALNLPLVSTGGDLPAVVTAIVPVIPGLSVDEGALADLGTVQDAVLREGLSNTVASEWWVATSDRAAAARQLGHRIPVGAAIETSDSVTADEVLGSANTVVWIAAVAIALLGMLAVAAGLLAELRARLGQVGLLRALGVAGLRQSSGRVVEIGALLGLGLVAGLIDGGIVSGFLVPDLARTAVPDALAALPTFLTVDPFAAAGSLAAVIAVAAALLVVTAVTVRRQARLVTGGENRL